jgi:hypothetical protein
VVPPGQTAVRIRLRVKRQPNRGAAGWQAPLPQRKHRTFNDVRLARAWTALLLTAVRYPQQAGLRLQNP